MSLQFVSWMSLKYLGWFPKPFLNGFSPLDIHNCIHIHNDSKTVLLQWVINFLKLFHDKQMYLMLYLNKLNTKYFIFYNSLPGTSNWPKSQAIYYAHVNFYT